MQSESIELLPLVSPEDDIGAPPPYTVGDPGWRLTYVDFTPKCINDGGIVSSAKFETFGVLVARANDYLHRHPTVSAKSMETTKFTIYNTKKPGTAVDTREATFKDTRSSGGMLVNGLRVWITPKQTTKAQQVGYLNVVPACLYPGGIFKSPKFDTLTETLKKLNKLLQQKPLPGQIINVETIDHRFDQYSKWLQPDRCHWVLHNDLSTSYLSFFRIYYEAGPQQPVEIGFKDFVPSRVRVSGPYSLKSEYESVDDLVSSAHVWIMSKPNHKHLNIETNYNTVKKGDSEKVVTDAALTTHYSSPDLLTTLRLWYTDHVGVSDTIPTSSALEFHNNTVYTTTSESSDVVSDPKGQISKVVTASTTTDGEVQNTISIQNSDIRVGCITPMIHTGNDDVTETVNISTADSDNCNFPNMDITCNGQNTGCNDLILSSHADQQEKFALKYETFWPVQLEGGGMFHSVAFESLIETRQRMKDWVLNNPDLNVISCETVHIKYDQSRPFDSRSVLNTFQSGSFGYNSTWLSVFRLCLLMKILPILSPLPHSDDPMTI